MFLVAIAELKGNVDARLPELATELGTTPYELRLVLNAGMPAVVLATVDEAKARAAAASIAKHGHAVVTLDRRSTVSSQQMTELGRFALTKSGLVADERGGDELPFADIGVLVRAMQRGTTTTTEVVKERKLRPIMAAATGGLVMSKKVTREVTRHEEQRDQVLYVFRRSGAPPWLLRERGALYAGLGADLGPTAFANFQTTIRVLRERAPSAVYDERLMSGRPIRGVADGSEATDLLAYLIAARSYGGP
ncbi:MAG TPA: hypothetical protein VH062_10835 [Polyangiaceae bacterium]|jgi:hypothetical protein|nr:hypothetical protein [Polyangiaceae bacterium]